MEQQVKYSDTEINAYILKAVREMGFEYMTPIQEQAIPVLLEGKDVIGQAQTGTGKTAAFSIPMIQGNWPCRQQKRFVRLRNICMV